MRAIRVHDDDPDSGPPRQMVYRVLHVTGPGAISLIGDYVQRHHPLEALRARGYDGGSVAEVQRSQKRHRAPVVGCACGKKMSRSAGMCQACAKLNRSRWSL